LDIQKAYDTVPTIAIEKGLRRIKVPENIITLICKLLDARLLKIDTPHGETEEFKPDIGIPQGDGLSPLLWSIFYDPLLCKLQQNTEGTG
jgi:hypothetical protein